jgi:hypothetical protein
MFKRARGMAHYEERHLRDTGQRTARRQIGHLAAATVVRVVDLADGLVVLVNAERTHAAFAAARALIETAAVPTYVLKNVVPHLAKGRAGRVDEVLRRLAVGLDGPRCRGMAARHSSDPGGEPDQRALLRDGQADAAQAR